MTSTNETLTAKDIGKFIYNGDVSSIINFIKSRRWFRRKSEKIKNIVFRDYAILNDNPIQLLTIMEIFYENFHSEIYYLPLMVHTEKTSKRGFETILEIQPNGNKILLYDAFEDITFCSNLLKLIKQKKQVKSLNGVFSFYPTGVGKLDMFIEHLNKEQIRLISTEQTNTSINYANSMIMKNFRNIEYGINPDFEITYFLTKETDLENIPALYGYIEYQNQDKLTATAAVLQEFITNRGDCWNYTLIFYEQIYRIAMRNVLISSEDKIKEVISEFGKSFISEMHKLGEITGKFHKALTTDLEDEAFKSELITEEDLNHWQTDMTNSIDSILNKIQHNLSTYSEDIQSNVKILLENKQQFLNKVAKLNLLKEANLKKIRIHGDYHLGQVLKTSDDFVILDFEGEPIKTMEERRAKYLPHKDIAGMLRSFNYATYASLFELEGIDPIELENLQRWAEIWEKIISNSFLEGYWQIMHDEYCKRETFNEILTIYKIDKAIYELEYEINNRPDWLRIPLEYLKSTVD